MWRGRSSNGHTAPQRGLASRECSDCFVAALLLGQVWQAPEGTSKLLFVFTVPDPSSFLIFAVMALLFFSSVFLAIASIVSKFQNVASQLIGILSTILSLMSLLAFIVGFTSALSVMPREQWWSSFLVFGGFVFILFLFYRFFRGLCLLNKNQQHESVE